MMRKTEFIHVWFLGPIKMTQKRGVKVIIRNAKNPYGGYSPLSDWSPFMEELRSCTMLEF